MGTIVYFIPNHVRFTCTFICYLFLFQVGVLKLSIEMAVGMQQQADLKRE